MGRAIAVVALAAIVVTGFTAWDAFSDDPCGDAFNAVAIDYGFNPDAPPPDDPQGWQQAVLSGLRSIDYFKRFGVTEEEVLSHLPARRPPGGDVSIALPGEPSVSIQRFGGDFHPVGAGSC